MIQRTVTGDPLLNPADHFTGSLAAWRNPSYLASLGHATGPDEPSGLLTGLATPAPIEATDPLEHADPSGSVGPVPGTADGWSTSTIREPAGPLAAPANPSASVQPVTVSRLVTAPPAPIVLRLPAVDAPAPALAGHTGETPAAPSPDGSPTLGADPLAATGAGAADSPALLPGPEPATELAPTDPGSADLSAETGTADLPLPGSPPLTSAPTRRLGLGEPIVPPLAAAPLEPSGPAGPLPVSRLTIPPAASSAIPDAPTGRPAPLSTSNPIGYAHPPARPTPTGPARPADPTAGPGSAGVPAHRDGPDLPLAPPPLAVARSVDAAPADQPGTDPPPDDPSLAGSPVSGNTGPEPGPAAPDGWSADADTRPTIGAEPVPLAGVDWSPDGPDRPDASNGPHVGWGDGSGGGDPMSPLLGAAPPVGVVPAGTSTLGATPVDATATGATMGVTVARTAAGDRSDATTGGSLGAATDGQTLGTRMSGQSSGVTSDSQSLGATAGDPAGGPGAGLLLPAQRMAEPDHLPVAGTGAAAPVVVARLIGERPAMTRLGQPADRRPATGPAVQRVTWDRSADGVGGAADFITATDSPNQPDINGGQDVFGAASRAVANQVGGVGTPAEAGDPLAASWPAGGNRPARSSALTNLDGFAPVTAGPMVSAVNRAPALTVARSTAETAGNRTGYGNRTGGPTGIWAGGSTGNWAGGSTDGPAGSAGSGGAAFGVPVAFSWVGSMEAAADQGPEPARTVQRADEPTPPEAPPGPVELSTGPQPEPPPASTGDAPPPSAAQPAAGPAAAPGAVEPEELLKKLFDPLLRRIKTELRLDRERHGLPGGVG